MLRVLIVDDQPSFRRQLRALLQIAGFEVVAEAGDILQAEQQVRAVAPDLAIVDVMLPGVNGIEGTARLKAIAPNLRIILVSAFTDRAHVFQRVAQQAGAEIFVPKDDLDLEMVRSWRITAP